MSSTLVTRIRIQADLYHSIKERYPDFNLSEFVRSELDKKFGSLLEEKPIIPEQKPKPTHEELIKEISNIIERKLTDEPL